MQSFDDDLLAACGRAHTTADTAEALSLLLDASARPSLRSVSIDLIGGLPKQSTDSWRRSLEAAAASGAHHVSVYDLQVEPRTAFGRWFTAGESPLPSEEDAAQMYRDQVTAAGHAFQTSKSWLFSHSQSVWARCMEQAEIHTRKRANRRHDHATMGMHHWYRADLKSADRAYQPPALRDTAAKTAS